MDVTLYVGNFSKETTEDQLLTLFTPMGGVSALRIMRDPHTGRSRGYAYITMSAQSEGDKAVSRLNDFSVDGHRLKVSLARPREVSGITRLKTDTRGWVRTKRDT